MGVVRTRIYQGGKLDATDFPLERVSDALEVPDSVVWVDLHGPSTDQLDALADELGLHHLAVEDALEPHQRPKLDHYDTHLFLSCHAIALDVERAQLAHTEIDAFIHPRWLVTVRKDGGIFPLDDALERWDRSPALARFGVGYLLHGVLDVVIDGYFAVVEAFDQYYDEVSERLFSDEPLTPAQEQQWFQMRRALGRFHRLVVPLREVVSTLLRRDDGQVTDGLRPYYQDLYDHILRISESTDALRDLVATIVETNLSLRDYRQNQIVKKVSSWAAIVAVPALITGYYGMNVPYPGSGTAGGVAVSTFLITAISGGLYVVFKRRDWL